MGTLSWVEPRRGAFATCWELLPHVSRTFALTIPVLLEPLRSYVGVAYLLCRIADTVEDAEDLPLERRRELFECFLELLNRPLDPLERRRFPDLWSGRVDAAHERLIRRTGDVLLAFASLPEPTRRPIRACLQEMIGGMAFTPIAGPGSRTVEVCADLPALERYCHVVAGTVGILLSRLFAGEMPGDWLSPERLEQGRRFGLGLQLTNVLKDETSDRRRGISYIPAIYRENPEEGALLSAEGARVLVGRALEHFDEANAYVLSLPPRRADMRLFCLWASHLALATLALVAAHPGRPVKVSRLRVGEILEATRARAKDNARLKELYRDLRATAASARPA
jgi:farnesyl-diphosphate farnesyltransferase